jgi:cytosine/adenosine deaminase-related metal-dependent hydrolase
VERLLRPYGIVIDGKLELGLELLLFDGVVQEVRPHTGIPDSFVISPAFVNAHSHLEYRGLQGKLTEEEYWLWLREITLAKVEQVLEQVQADAGLAAAENRRTGVAIIGEHSDRPVSGHAMKLAHLGGAIFQEVITRFKPETARDRLQASLDKAASQTAEAGVTGFAIPHAYHTVDDETLREFGRSGEPFSIHVAETDLENQLTLFGTGPIADTYKALGVDYTPAGKRLVPTLHELGLVREGAQFVHCCALDESDIGLMAAGGVSVAHCPRSNVRLKCPIAPVREMLDAGLQVGLGLDSPASGGPIDMFDEMRCAVSVSLDRGRPLEADEIWRMATSMGANSLRFAVPWLPDWEIRPGSTVPLIKIGVEDAYSASDLIEKATPDRVEWVM